MKPLPTVPIEILNFVALLFAVASSAWACFYYLDIGLDRVGTLAAVATGGIAGTLYGFLPPNAKLWVKGIFSPLLSSSRVLIAVAAYVVAVFTVGVLFTRIAIDWKDGQPTIVVDGSRANIQPDDRSYSIWGLPYKDRSLVIGDTRRNSC